MSLGEYEETIPMPDLAHLRTMRQAIREGHVPIVINHRGSLLTYHRDGQETCLGYLFNFPGKGVYDPNLGKVDVSVKDANVHNRCLSEAEIKGLDEACEIGQWGVFYFNREEMAVKTWMGVAVARNEDVEYHGSGSVTFHRRGKRFMGKVYGQECLLRFRRVA